MACKDPRGNCKQIDVAVLAWGKVLTFCFDEYQIRGWKIIPNYGVFGGGGGGSAHDHDHPLASSSLVFYRRRKDGEDLERFPGLPGDPDNVIHALIPMQAVGSIVAVPQFFGHVSDCPEFHFTKAPESSHPDVET